MPIILFYIKVVFIIIYSSIGLLYGLAASGLFRLDNFRSVRALSVMAFCASIVLFFYWILKGNLALLVPVLLGVIALSAVGGASLRLTLNSFVSIVPVLSLAWWQFYNPILDPGQIALFIIILVMIYIGLSNQSSRMNSWITSPITILYLFIGLIIAMNVAPYNHDSFNLWLLAHHWGAYIGPALHFNAGLVPYYDIPLQYGLGPTLVLGALCKMTSCWVGGQLLFVSTTIFMSGLLLKMALDNSSSHSWAWTISITIIMFCAIYFWAGNPSHGYSLLATPSVSGVRFLPVTLVAYLLFYCHYRTATVALFLAIFWSVESALMSVIVYGLAEVSRVKLFDASLKVIYVVSLAFATLIILHHAIYNIWLDPLAYLEYILHVPGPLPINPFSDVLLLSLVLFLGVYIVIPVRSSSANDVIDLCKRRDIITVSLLYATSTYFLGRSHPNNICNLMPFISLVAIRCFEKAYDKMLVKAIRIGLATSVATIAFSPWKTSPINPSPEFDINSVVNNIPSSSPDFNDLRKLITTNDVMGIAEFGPNDIRNPAETIVWTPMDPSSLWGNVPSDRRKIYIRRSAVRLRRSGWVIASENRSFIIEDLRSSYQVYNERHVRSPSSIDTNYFLGCFEPKPEVSSAIIGGHCPR